MKTWVLQAKNKRKQFFNDKIRKRNFMQFSINFLGCYKMFHKKYNTRLGVGIYLRLLWFQIYEGRLKGFKTQLEEKP